MAEKESFNLTSESISHGAVPWKVSDVVLSYILIFALSILAVGIILLTGLDINSSLLPAFLQIFLSLITIGLVYFIVTKKYSVPSSKAFGFSSKKIPKSLTTGIAVSFMLVISTTLISLAFSEFAGSPKQSPYVNMPSEKLRIISMLAVFVAPFVEEIFFRGFMQPAMIKSFGAFGGIFVTALIFGLSHAQYFDYSVALVAVTVIGLILGTTRYYTGSVMPGIIAHLLNNFFAAMSLQ